MPRGWSHSTRVHEFSVRRGNQSSSRSGWDLGDSDAHRSIDKSSRDDAHSGSSSNASDYYGARSTSGAETGYERALRVPLPAEARGDARVPS